MKELYEKRRKIFEDMKAFLDAHEQMTAEDEEKFKKMGADYDAIDKKIKAYEKMRALEAELSEPMTEPIVAPEAQAPKHDPEKDYISAFEAYVRGIDLEKIKAFRAQMTEGTDADGGYLVPVSYQKKVIEKLLELSDIRKIANVIQTASTRKIPISETIPSFSWIDETGTYGETKATFSQKSIGAHKVGGIIKVSEELLQDSMIDLRNYLTNKIAQGFDVIEGEAFVNGDGSGKPRGILLDAPVGSNSTTAATNAVTADEILDIYYDLKAPYRKNAYWLMNDATEKAIRKLKNSQGDYIFSPSMSEAERSTLLGRPIIIDPNMPTIGAGNKFIVIGDFRYYQIGDRGGMSLQRLNERYAELGLIGFKVYKRLDALIILTEAFNVGQNATT